MDTYEADKAERSAAYHRQPGVIRTERQLTAETLLQSARMILAIERRTTIAPVVFYNGSDNPTQDFLASGEPNRLVRMMTFPNESADGKTMTAITCFDYEMLQDLTRRGKPIDKAVTGKPLEKGLIASDINVVMGFLKPVLPTREEQTRELRAAAAK
jgi:hypothetical protein